MRYLFATSCLLAAATAVRLTLTQPPPPSGASRGWNSGGYRPRLAQLMEDRFTMAALAADDATLAGPAADGTAPATEQGG